MGTPERPGSRDPVGATPSSARDRLLNTAYELFCYHGIRAVGIDRIVADSGVAKMTLYRHFASKEELGVAFLQLREQRWTEDWLEAEMERRGETPQQRLLAIFDAFDEWFQRRDYEGCAFQNTLLEFHEEGDPLHQEAIAQLETVRALVEVQAAAASAADPTRLASQIHILMMGAIMSARLGHRDAARDARRVAQLLLDAM